MDHARYANGCRRTLGRAGASGVHGVRQRLQDLHGRSPDPEEVAEEMQCHKGYEKKDLERRKDLKRKNTDFDDTNFEDQSMRIQSLQTDVDNRSKDEDPTVMRKSRKNKEVEIS